MVENHKVGDNTFGDIARKLSTIPNNLFAAIVSDLFYVEYYSKLAKVRVEKHKSARSGWQHYEKKYMYLRNAIEKIEVYNQENPDKKIDTFWMTDPCSPVEYAYVICIKFPDISAFLKYHSSVVIGNVPSRIVKSYKITPNRKILIQTIVNHFSDIIEIKKEKPAEKKKNEKKKPNIDFDKDSYLFESRKIEPKKRYQEKSNKAQDSDDSSEHKNKTQPAIVTNITGDMTPSQKFMERFSRFKK